MGTVVKVPATSYCSHCRRFLFHFRSSYV